MPSGFQFKRFFVAHDRCAMKVGTDGVLLGAWAQTNQRSRILEIGSGSGLITLMLAQRTEATQRSDETPVSIDAVEIDFAACEQARENIAASPWQDRINVHCCSIQSFASGQPDSTLPTQAIRAPHERFDLVVCNPPYFSGDSVPPDARRNLARHSASLTETEFWKLADQLGQPTCGIAIITPEQSADLHLQLAQKNGFTPVRQTMIFPMPGRAAVRRLIECQRTRTSSDQCVYSELTLEVERHQRTPAFSELIRDFYLNP